MNKFEAPEIKVLLFSNSERVGTDYLSDGELILPDNGSSTQSLEF